MRLPAFGSADSADRHLLSLATWQFIGSLSFKCARISDAQQVANFKSALRKVSRALGVRFQDVLWGLKLEWGEIGDRPHFHFVLARFPVFAVTTRTCALLKDAWFQKGGGRVAKVEVFNPQRDGLAYIAKRANVRPGGAVRSTAKFGVNGESMLFSDNFVRLVGRSA